MQHYGSSSDTDTGSFDENLTVGSTIAESSVDVVDDAMSSVVNGVMQSAAKTGTKQMAEAASVTETDLSETETSGVQKALFQNDDSTSVQRDEAYEDSPGGGGNGNGNGGGADKEEEGTSLQRDEAYEDNPSPQRDEAYENIPAPVMHRDEAYENTDEVKQRDEAYVVIGNSGGGCFAVVANTLRTGRTGDRVNVECILKKIKWTNMTFAAAAAACFCC